MLEPSLIQNCWFLTGATATGKTGIGLQLAERLGAQIISLDSMAIYRGMDIGTAKPTADQRRRVPHHLLDIRDPWQEFSVAQYAELAQAVIAEIVAAGQVPLLVGGTPLYLKVLLRGLDQVPKADWQFRRQVQEEAEKLRGDALYERVRQVDPLAAERLHPSDTRRLIRVLEVYSSTGMRLSHLQMTFEEGRAPDECRVFVLRRPREAIHQRIDLRVERMFERGLIDEVKRLLKDPRGLGRTARQAVGYGEVIDLIGDRQTYEATVELMKQRTRRFAKRQETWFRSLQECRFVDLADDANAEDVAERILHLAETGSA